MVGQAGTGRGLMLIGPALKRPNEVALIGGRGHFSRTFQLAASAALLINCKQSLSRCLAPARTPRHMQPSIRQTVAHVLLSRLHNVSSSPQTTRPSY